VTDLETGQEPVDISALRAAPVSTTEQAYTTVRQAIINADLAPGQIVSQVRLAAELNISRTPLREALRRLQSQGLLEGDFNRRLRVAPLTIDDLEQVAAMRIVLETLGVQSTVPKLGAEGLDRISHAFDGMDRAWSVTSDLQDFRVHHRIFHTTLFSKVGSRIRTQLEDLWDQAERYRVFYRQSADDRVTLAHIAHDEHAAIRDAAAQADAPLCGKLIASHLARTALGTIAKLDATHDPIIIREATTIASGAKDGKR
jgi:DNA-binding GntR family transcriptional regulator